MCWISPLQRICWNFVSMLVGIRIFVKLWTLRCMSVKCILMILRKFIRVRSGIIRISSWWRDGRELKLVRPCRLELAWRVLRTGFILYCWTVRMWRHALLKLSPCMSGTSPGTQKLIYDFHNTNICFFYYFHLCTLPKKRKKYKLQQKIEINQSNHIQHR